MAISAWAIKGMAGVGAVGITATGIICREQIYETFTGEINYQKLNLPKDCGLSNKQGCTLDKSKLEKVNFINKETGNLTVTDNANAILKIEKTSDTNTFPKGLKFIFKTSSAIEVKNGNDDTNKIVLKENTNPEFKLEVKNNKYVLKKVWDKEHIKEKLGLSCTESGSTKECELVSGKTINVFKAEGDYITGATLENNKKIKFSADETNHNQGWKFTVDNNVSLKGGTKKKSDGISQLTNSNNSYEIQLKIVDISGKPTPTWFLLEKTSNS